MEVNAIRIAETHTVWRNNSEIFTLIWISGQREVTENFIDNALARAVDNLNSYDS